MSAVTSQLHRAHGLSCQRQPRWRCAAFRLDVHEFRVGPDTPAQRAPGEPSAPGRTTTRRRRSPQLQAVHRPVSAGLPCVSREFRAFLRPFAALMRCASNDGTMLLAEKVSHVDRCLRRYCGANWWFGRLTVCKAWERVRGQISVQASVGRIA
jgi:hypothetical protein